MNKKYRYLKNSNEGVAGVLVALLMIGLIISAISFIQMYYVPQWMKEKESEHLNLVSTQFSQLKFSIDNLAMNEKKYSPLSVPITLGTKELPFLSSTRSHGNLEVSPDDFQIKINYSAYNPDPNFIMYDIGSIKYSSENTQYINQVYAYEAGAVILSQDEGELVRIKPSLSIKYNGDLVLEITKVNPSGGKNTVAGYSTCPVQFEYLNTKNLQLSDVKNITLMNTHVDAWFKYFNETFSSYPYLDNISYTPGNKGVIIEFSDTVSYPNLELKLTEMNVQLSKGWIK